MAPKLISFAIIMYVNVLVNEIHVYRIAVYINYYITSIVIATTIHGKFWGGKIGDFWQIVRSLLIFTHHLASHFSYAKLECSF